MKLNDFKTFPNMPGIYYFKNTLNNKYYIGQAQNIRTRLKMHKTNFINEYYTNSHLYRSWRTYGIDVFEVGVLEIVDLPKGPERNKKLDELEIKYIEQFNSYGTGGYNQTRGGDGGVFGYKFTDIQKEHISINTLKMCMDGRFKVYFYDIILKKYGSAPTFRFILDIISPNTNSPLQEHIICHYGRYIIARSPEKLEDKIKIFYSSDYNKRLATNKGSNNIIKEINYPSFDLQTEIDNKVDEYNKRIEDFYVKNGHSKYNRKENLVKKDARKAEQKEDLKNGITREEYKQKYNIKSNQTFNKHVCELCYELVEKYKECKNTYTKPMTMLTDEMRRDIIDGISQHDFIEKYKLSDSSFQRYKHKIEEELGIKIESEIYNPRKNYISEAEERDFLNCMPKHHIMSKYNLTENTYYSHKKVIKKRFPENDIEPFDREQHKEKVDINLIKDDIINGISLKEFCLKYQLSESTYKKYRKKILNIPNAIQHTITE